MDEETGGGHQMKAYTIQLCSRCGKAVKMDFLSRLLSLDEKVLCDECKRLDA